MRVCLCAQRGVRVLEVPPHTLSYTGYERGLIEPQQLLSHNAKVYLAARSAQKADEAIAELKNETGKEAIFLQLDLSDIPAIRRSAQEFLSYVPVMFVSFSSRLTKHAFSGKRVNCMSLSTMRESRVVAVMCGFSAAADRPWCDHSGVMMSPKEQLTIQKYDMQFGTNVTRKRAS